MCVLEHSGVVCAFAPYFLLQIFDTISTLISIHYSNGIVRVSLKIFQTTTQEI
jgi:hypothetical protein